MFPNLILESLLDPYKVFFWTDRRSRATAAVSAMVGWTDGMDGRATLDARRRLDRPTDDEVDERRVNDRRSVAQQPRDAADDDDDDDDARNDDDDAPKCDPSSPNPTMW